MYLEDEHSCSKGRQGVAYRIHNLVMLLWIGRGSYGQGEGDSRLVLPIELLSSIGGMVILDSKLKVL